MTVTLTVTEDQRDLEVAEGHDDLEGHIDLV